MSAEANFRRVLMDFARDFTNAENPREGVSVSVRRREGFQNEALTPKGKQILLDEPVHMGGRGEAPDPAEYLLAAAGASLSVTLTVHATLQNVRIDSIAIGLSAEIDGRPFFDPDDTSEKPGLLDILVELEVKSPEPAEVIEALVDRVMRSAPVLQTLNQVPRLSLTVLTS